MEYPEKSKLPRIKPNVNLEYSLKILTYMGNWPWRDEIRRYYYVYTFLYFILGVAVYIFVQCAYMIVVWGNLEKMIAGSFLLMTNTGNCYKMLVILSRRKRIQSLIDIVHGKIFSSDNLRYERILSHYTWQGIFHHAAYQSLGSFSTCCWATSSLMNIIVNDDKRLPITSWYPYNVTKTPNFEITCAQQILGEMILCVHNIALDIFVTNFINIACCQLAILKKNIERIGDDCDEDAASAASNERACEKLKSCIEHNKVIIYFKQEIQEIFGTSILFQCFVNCAIICLTAFHISRMDDYAPAALLGTGFYLCGMIYQIFIYCWHGNELTLHSEGIALAAYTGFWWKFDERYKRTLRILMIRSRRPLVLTVGKIMNLSLDTFTSILRLSYSLFTVLQSTTIAE